MNIKQIKELIDLMNANELTEVEIEEEGTKIKLVKKPQGVIEEMTLTSPEKKPSDLEEKKPELAQVQERNVREVKSPMVGTFYRTASPDAEPYVDIGDVVQKGDVLCIVEAMKLMNEVKAEFGGRIMDILIGNAEPVEYNQTIFLIEA